MNLSIDQFIYGIGIILIPIIVAIIHKRRKVSHTTTPPPNKINEIEGRLKKLEESIIKNHIEIDEAKLEIAHIKGYLKGKLSDGK